MSRTALRIAAVVVALSAIASPVRAERRSSATFDARQIVALTNESRRRAILNPPFTQIGVADANGIVVVMFGRPAASKRP